MTNTLDVRPDLAEGREPFGRIMQAAANLEPGERLVVIAPFEPVPLYGVLASQGFVHEANRTGDGAWEVIFTRNT